jgi:hypothetical protein
MAVKPVAEVDYAAKLQNRVFGEGANTSVRKEVVIMPRPAWTASTEQPSESFPGLLRNTSPNGIGLAHDRPLEPGQVLVGLEMEDDEDIVLIVDLVWCKRQPDGQYYSTGKVKELITSSDCRDA